VSAVGAVGLKQAGGLGSAQEGGVTPIASAGADPAWKAPVSRLRRPARGRCPHRAGLGNR
jgi:hypothetical protein